MVEIESSRIRSNLGCRGKGIPSGIGPTTWTPQRSRMDRKCEKTVDKMTRTNSIGKGIERLVCRASSGLITNLNAKMMRQQVTDMIKVGPLMESSE